MPTKGDFVRGIVEAVNERSATVLLDSGHRAALSWSNFTKQADYKPQPDAASSSSPEGQPLPSLPLAAGDKVWACVLQVPKPDGKDGACVQLSTAALEVRPGDMLRQPKHVMAGLEQWAARGGRTPLQEWRGRLELEQFVLGNAGGGKGSKSTTAAAAAAAVAEPAAPSAVWGPGSWGLPLAPLPGRGDCVRGSVTSVKPYGVFLRLDSRHDGFIPLSQVRSGKWREGRERGIQLVGHPPLARFIHYGCFTMQMYLNPPCVQISKSYTEGQSLVQQGPLKRGDAVVALIRRLNEDEEDEEEAPQGRGVDRDGEEEGAPPAVRRRQPRGWDTSSSKAGAAAPAVAGGRRPKATATAAGAAATPDTLLFVLSTRVLEAEEGLIRRSLEDYNSR